jgi:hypothetical protein
MPEIDRLHNAISAHFEILGCKDGKRSEAMAELYGKKLTELLEPVDRCVMTATTRAFSVKLEDQEACQKRVEAAQESVDALKQEITDGTVTPERFKAVAFEAMIARRATYPLEGETPWDKLDPEEALLDDDDSYSFSIWDSVVEPIQDALPALHQLACEDWEDTPTEKEEDG